MANDCHSCLRENIRSSRVVLNIHALLRSFPLVAHLPGSYSELGHSSPIQSAVTVRSAIVAGHDEVSPKERREWRDKSMKTGGIILFAGTKAAGTNTCVNMSQLVYANWVLSIHDPILR